MREDDLERERERELKRTRAVTVAVSFRKTRSRLSTNSRRPRGETRDLETILERV